MSRWKPAKTWNCNWSDRFISIPPDGVSRRRLIEDRSDDNRARNVEVIGESGRRASDRQRAGIDGARSGDRRRRSRSQYEAGVRGGSRQARRDWRTTARRGVQNDRQDIGDDGRRRLGAALRKFLHGGGRGAVELPATAR